MYIFIHTYIQCMYSVDECIQRIYFVTINCISKIKQISIIIEKLPCSLFNQILPLCPHYSDFYHRRLFLSVTELHLKWNIHVLLCLAFFGIWLFSWYCVLKIHLYCFMCQKLIIFYCYYMKILLVYPFSCKRAFEWFPGLGYAAPGK